MPEPKNVFAVGRVYDLGRYIHAPSEKREPTSELEPLTCSSYEFGCVRTSPYCCVRKSRLFRRFSLIWRSPFVHCVPVRISPVAVRRQYGGSTVGGRAERLQVRPAGRHGAPARARLHPVAAARRDPATSAEPTLASVGATDSGLSGKSKLTRCTLILMNVPAFGSVAARRLGGRRDRR